MRVLLANKFFFRKGGSEVVMLQERDYLLSVGVEVVDFSMTHPLNMTSPHAASFVSAKQYHEPQNPVSHIKTALSLVHSIEATRKLDLLIRQTKPELMHCHNIYHQLTPSIIGAAKRHGVPVVLTLHDYKSVCPVYTRLRNGAPCSACLSEGFGAVLRYRCAEGSLSRSALLYGEAVVQRLLGNYEKVDRFIAPSCFMRDSVLRRFNADQVSLLYNGVEVPSRKFADIDEGYVLYLGRLSREKGVESLLEAQRLYGPKWDVRIAGSGPLERSLKEKYPAAKFLGHLDGMRLESVLQRAGVVVVPSQWYENCPMSVLEAMAYGKPVVGSRIGGIPELIVDNMTGLLFEPGQTDQLAGHIDRLISDSRMRKQLGRAARERIESKFSLTQHHQQLIKIYKSLIVSGH